LALKESFFFLLESFAATRERFVLSLVMCLVAEKMLEKKKEKENELKFCLKNFVLVESLVKNDSK
jgi:hypothetical protein